jgi:hypothetical protein
VWLEILVDDLGTRLGMVHEPSKVANVTNQIGARSCGEGMDESKHEDTKATTTHEGDWGVPGEIGAGG